ncbi:hypothetical protein [Secundilactobacillus silagincola]|uniref:hypothetical protein n=1 Tax=Secundilactobacillus silagincola TaxID=1714681 RepID=UPI0015D5173C|nr:hypothetical protein [Secundilactobacillus silagincola]
MTESQKNDTPDEPAPAKKPLNLNDLASNPMRVGMERMAQEKKSQTKQQKKHWWSRKKK